MHAIMDAPPITSTITFSNSRYPVYELDLGLSPAPGLPEATVAFLKTELGPDQPLPSLINRKRECPVVIQVRLIPTAAGFGAASRLLSHGGVLSVPFQGATRLFTVRNAAALLPPGCVRFMMLNVPGHLGSSALPRAALEQAGYAVEEPGAGAGALAPRPGLVTLCQIRPAILKGGAGHHTGTIIAEIIPPLGDPWLRDLPPALIAEGLEGHWMQTLIEGDPLARAPRPHAHPPPPAPAAVAHAGGPGHLLPAAGAAFAGAPLPLAAPLSPAVSGAHPQAVDAAEPSGSPSQGQPPGQGLGSVAGGSGGLAPSHRAPGVQNAPSFAPGGYSAPTPGGSPSSPNLVPSGSLGQGFGVEAGGEHGGAPPPRAPGVQESALSAPGGPAVMPPGSSAPAALLPSISPPAPSGMASPPPPLPPDGPAPCPICQEPLGPSGFTTTPCGHQFCTQCFVTTAATNARDNKFPCPACRRSIDSPIQEALSLVNSPERAAWDREQESLELARLLAESMEEDQDSLFSPFLDPASSLSPPPEPLPFSPPPEPGISPVPSSAPRVSAPPLASPQLQHAPAAPSTGAAPDLSAVVAAMGSASTSSAPWRRRSQRENFGRQPSEPFWVSNPAARRSNDGSRSSSVAPSRSGRHRSRSTSPPARTPPAPAASTMPSSGYETRPRLAWGSALRRQLAWGSGIRQSASPSPPPPSSQGGRGRW